LRQPEEQAQSEFQQGEQLVAWRIVAGLPTEFPRLEVRTQQSDLLFRLADDGGVLHLEAQTQYRAEHLLRFANYHLAAYAEHGGPVHTIIVYGAGVRSAPSALRTGGLTFRVHNIFIGRKDARPCSGVSSARRPARRPIRRRIAST